MYVFLHFFKFFFNVRVFAFMHHVLHVLDAPAYVHGCQHDAGSQAHRRGVQYVLAAFMSVCLPGQWAPCCLFTCLSVCMYVCLFVSSFFVSRRVPIIIWLHAFVRVCVCMCMRVCACVRTCVLELIHGCWLRIMSTDVFAGINAGVALKRA